MPPFAYQFLDTDYGELTANEVFPTLRAAYEWIIKERPTCSRTSGLEIRCWYSAFIGGRECRWHDLSLDSVTFQHRREPTEVELGAIRVGAHAEMEAGLLAQANWAKQHTGLGQCPPHSSFTGVKTYLIESRTAACGVNWKTPDEIDWAALADLLECDSTP